MAMPEMIAKNRPRFSHGVVHSFTGEMDEMLKLVELGLYIGAPSPSRLIVLRALSCTFTQYR